MIANSSTIVFSCSGGVSALSFIQTHVIISSANMSAVVATPDGSAPSFHVRCSPISIILGPVPPRRHSPQIVHKFEDIKCEQWLKSKQNVVNAPRAVEDVDPAEYAGLVIPSSAGGLIDFTHERTSPKVARVVAAFVDANKPICAVGFGVAALFSAKRSDKCLFSGKNMTCVRLLLKTWFYEAAFLS
jgi:putative intracellular protease/amidase